MQVQKHPEEKISVKTAACTIWSGGVNGKGALEADTSNSGELSFLLN
jgi:hypothetical protein